MYVDASGRNIDDNLQNPELGQGTPGTIVQTE